MLAFVCPGVDRAQSSQIPLLAWGGVNWGRYSCVTLIFVPGLYCHRDKVDVASTLPEGNPLWKFKVGLYVAETLSSMCILRLEVDCHCTCCTYVTPLAGCILLSSEPKGAHIHKVQHQKPASRPKRDSPSCNVKSYAHASAKPKVRQLPWPYLLFH